MGGQLTGLLGIIGGAFGVLSTGAVTYLTVAKSRSEADREAAKTWRENAEAEKARADRLELRVDELTIRVQKVETENAVLRSLATGEAAIRALALSIESNHSEIMAALRGEGEG